MSRFEAVQFPDDDRYHIDILIRPDSAILRLTFAEQAGLGEAEEMAETLNEQIESVSFQLLSVGGGPEHRSWREDVD